jgi:hypothetical protein
MKLMEYIADPPFSLRSSASYPRLSASMTSNRVEQAAPRLCRVLLPKLPNREEPMMGAHTFKGSDVLRQARKELL